MGILRSARKGYASISRGYGGGSFSGAWGSPLLSGGGRDWNRDAGLRYDTCAVYAAIAWAVKAFLEVDVYARRQKRNGEYEEIKNHPAIQLLKKPNPWYDFPTLLSGWLISEITGRAGSSYTYKHRSPADKLIGLEYIPHFAIWPFTNPGSGKFIDWYQLSLLGGYMKVDPKNILQQRFGPIDPLRPQICFGPLNSVLLEIATEKQALNYTAALLLNVGVTPHLISPAIKDINGQMVTFGTDQIDQVREAFEQQITGDNRGRPLLSPLPIKVDDLSFSPADMALPEIHNLNEEHICAAIGISPLTLHLGTGLENTNNRASAEAAAKADARDFTKPYMLRKAVELTSDLIPELGAPGEEICFRWQSLEALQEDKTETAKRDAIECKTYKTVNEKRAEKGLPPLPGWDTILASPKNAAEQGDDTTDPTQETKQAT